MIRHRVVNEGLERAIRCRAGAPERPNPSSELALRAACGLVASQRAKVGSLWLPGVSREFVEEVAEAYGLRASIEFRSNGCVVQLLRTEQGEVSLQ
jgi:hypothetical protein